MTMNAKKELLQGCLKRYLKAGKREKKTILDELEAHTKMHRKSLIRALRRLQMQDSGLPRGKPGRKIIYSPDVNLALKDIWEISRYLCGERLKPIIAEYVRILKRDKLWSHGDKATRLLLQMSLGTTKNIIAGFSNYKRKSRNSTTGPGHLHYLIPIRTSPWENPEPGFGEIDTVVHCGDSLAGNVAYTVNYTDIATGWNEQAAQLNKGQSRTLESIKTIKQRLPFALQGLDPDTGAEFINWHLKGWRDANKIELTRSRPYHRNDNAHIEQKNYTSVRSFVGWRRVDAEKQIKLLNELYEILHLYLNFFQPTMKCVSKERIGSRYIRRYDEPKTPFQRTLEHPRVKQQAKQELRQIYKTLNPLKLKQEIDKLIARI